jgi:hypothetical protein
MIGLNSTKDLSALILAAVTQLNILITTTTLEKFVGSFVLGAIKP